MSDRVVAEQAAVDRSSEILPVELPSPRDQIDTKALPEFASLRARVYEEIMQGQAKAPARDLAGVVLGRRCAQGVGGPTRSVAPGRVQCNLIVLPEAWAGRFRRLVRRQPGSRAGAGALAGAGRPAAAGAGRDRPAHRPAAVPRLPRRRGGRGGRLAGRPLAGRPRRLRVRLLVLAGGGAAAWRRATSPTSGAASAARSTGPRARRCRRGRSRRRWSSRCGRWRRRPPPRRRGQRALPAAARGAGPRGRSRCAGRRARRAARRDRRGRRRARRGAGLLGLRRHPAAVAGGRPTAAGDHAPLRAHARLRPDARRARPRGAR